MIYQRTSIAELTNPLNSFADKVMKGLSGEKGIIEPTFVYLPGVPGGDVIAKETGCDFFSVPVELGVGSPDSMFAFLLTLN